MAAHLPEPSSSLSFASSTVSNPGSPTAIAAGEPRSSLEIVSLSKLSSNLERLLVEKDFDCSDAEIVVEGEAVPVHRCILAARSRFFHELFVKGSSSRRSSAGDDGGAEAADGKPRYRMSDLVSHGRVRAEAFRTFLGYLYTGKLKPSPPEVSSCADAVCAHDACGPAINFAVELMYASSVFQIPELVSLLQRRLINFIEKALVEDVVPILLVAHRCRLIVLLKLCIQRVARSNLDGTALAKELPADAVDEIKLLRDPPAAGEVSQPKPVSARERTIQRIHRALDSDDVELLMMLLEESDITLDDAAALHYAVAYCDSKVIKEILPLNCVDVNRKNSRGYTPLHLASRRREPAIIVSLLDKGASVRIVADDGQTAATICRRLTRAKDYNAKAGHGQETNKDRLCIEILERELRRDPMAAEELVMSPIVPDDLHMKLLYLENRGLAFARLFFPMEAKVAMEIAQADRTFEFGGLSASRGSSNNLNDVDLNETPIKLKERLQARMEALRRTVELGKRYFPNCSSVVDKFMDDDIQDLLVLEKGPPEDQSLKRMRFIELKEDVLRAFSKDKAESTTRSAALSSSSSSSSPLRADKKSMRAR